jgi:hypothetical protein
MGLSLLQTLGFLRGFMLILEAKLGSGPHLGPQTDPKLALTECHNCPEISILEAKLGEYLNWALEWSMILI